MSIHVTSYVWHDTFICERHIYMWQTHRHVRGTFKWDRGLVLYEWCSRARFLCGCVIYASYVARWIHIASSYGWHDIFIRERHIHICETHSNETEDFFIYVYRWVLIACVICVAWRMCDMCGVTHTWLHVYVWHVWRDSYALHISHMRETHLYVRDDFFICVYRWFLRACWCVTCVAWLIHVTHFSYAKNTFLRETWFLYLRVSIGLKGLFMCDICGMTHSRYTFLIYTCMDGARDCVFAWHMCIICGITHWCRVSFIRAYGWGFRACLCVTNMYYMWHASSVLLVFHIRALNAFFICVYATHFSFTYI